MATKPGNLALPQLGYIVRVFVGSPDDLTHEREVVVEEIAKWNACHSKATGVMLDAVRWETHAAGDLRKPPQEVISRQLADDSDFLIALFWTKLGSGGTRKEIQEFLDAGKRVLLLFSNNAVPPGDLNTRELSVLQKFKEDMKPTGLYHEFSNDGTLREQLQRGIGHEISELKNNLTLLNAKSTTHQQAIFVEDHDIRRIISERLGDPDVRKITVVAYTNEVEFASLVHRHVDL